MRQQELQDDAERMKNKQTATLGDVVASAQVDSCNIDGASTVAASSPQGNDAISSEVQHSELILRNSEAFKQMRISKICLREHHQVWHALRSISSFVLILMIFHTDGR